MNKQKKKIIYKSNARWSKCEDSTDTHETKLMAQGVCDMLMENYGKHECPIRGLCLKTWVTEEQGK